MGNLKDDGTAMKSNVFRNFLTPCANFRWAAVSLDTSSDLTEPCKLISEAHNWHSQQYPQQKIFSSAETCQDANMICMPRLLPREDLGGGASRAQCTDVNRNTSSHHYFRSGCFLPRCRILLHPCKKRTMANTRLPAVRPTTARRRSSFSGLGVKLILVHIHHHFNAAH
jgi:hypothetical protein